MDPLIFTQALNVVYGVTTLALLVLGLAVIFGLLGVLNIAHGEFIMAGAYCAYVTFRRMAGLFSPRCPSPSSSVVHSGSWSSAA